MKHTAYVGIEIECKSSQDCAVKAIELLEGFRKGSDIIGQTHLFATDDKPASNKAHLITFVLYEIFKIDSSDMFKNIISNIWNFFRKDQK